MPRHMHGRSSLRSLPAAVGTALVLMLALAGCVGYGGPRTITLSAADLQRLVDRQFPLERRFLEVLDVSVSAPRMRLLPERRRLGTELDVAVRDKLFGGRWQGHLALDSALRYEPRDQSLRLQQVRVDAFNLDNGGGPLPAQAERVAALLAERVLDDMVVYRLPPERLADLQRHGLVPSAVEVTARGLEVTLSAAPPPPAADGRPAAP